MKIGIITYWTSQENYGQILQCFALQRYLRNLGHDAYLIKYNNRGCVKKNPFWLKALRALNPYIFIRHFYLKHKNSMCSRKAEVFPRYFDEFFSKYINHSPLEYFSYKELKENPPEADVYICGSDQIWNKYVITSKEERVHCYFLDFGSTSIIRVAYATSFAFPSLQNDLKEIISPLIKRFNAISVREKTAIDICKYVGFDNAKWVCDPTLLFDAKEYRRVYNENPIRRYNKKYLLFYHLYSKLNEIDFDISTVFNFARDKDLEVVYVTTNENFNKYEKTYPTIPEWLYLIDNAEYVVSNSFHGSVFAITFGKKFGVIPCAGKPKQMNTRLDSLFEMCHIVPRYLKRGDSFAILDKPYTVDISAFRQQSMDFLDKALNMTEKGGGYSV